MEQQVANELSPIEKINNLITIRDVALGLGLDYNDNYMCICPIHKDSDASLKLYPDNHFHCYGCGAYGDSIDLVAKTLNLTKHNAIKWIFSNLIENKSFIKKTRKERNNRAEQSQYDGLTPQQVQTKIATYVRNCEYHALETQYFNFRGLTQNTIRQFHLGFDPFKNEVIVPYNRALTYYQSRGVNKKFFKKLKTSVAGKEPIFNVGALLANKPIVFLVESPFCAMSIYQCGGVAVPLCGTQNVGKFLSFFANHLYKGVLVIALDNDNAGEIATNKIIGGTQKNAGLSDLGIHYVVKNISSECKDPNELLVKDSQRLKNNIEKTINEIEEIKQNVWNEYPTG